MIIEQKPEKDFSGLIEKIWVRPRRGGHGHSFFEILPDGNFDLVFILNDSGCRLLYTGPYTELRRVPFFDRFEYFCIRFRPGIMPRVADVQASTLVNSWAELPGMLGAGTDGLGERIFSAPDLGHKVRFIESFFRRKNLGSVLPSRPFLSCVRLIEQSRGAIGVGELSSRTQTSRRSLERLFLEQTGLPPKTFIRMIRFQHVLARLEQPGSFRTLADLAYESGYSDQSHFIRDFKNLAHRPPGRIRALSRFYNTGSATSPTMADD